jgi:hypothetical protein
MTAAMIEVGNGTHALIGIHGWFEGRKQWSSIAPYLDTKIFTHYFPSLRGDDVRKHERRGRTHRDVSDDIAALAASRGLTPTPRGAQLCDWSARTLQLLADNELRHIQVWFNTDTVPLANSQPLNGILDAQHLGIMKSLAAEFISTNRYDPFASREGSRQLAEDWCAGGADVKLGPPNSPHFSSSSRSTICCPTSSPANAENSGSQTDSTVRPRDPTAQETRRDRAKLIVDL